MARERLPRVPDDLRRARLAKPISNFLKDFLHVHQLNRIVVTTLIQFEDLNKFLAKAIKYLASENDIELLEKAKEIETEQKDNIALVEKEMLDGFHTVMTSELLLLYSRLESAIDEVIYLYFSSAKLKEIPSVDSAKIDLTEFAALSSVRQRNLLAEFYIQQHTMGKKYGFDRFEAIIEPIFGKSKLSNDLKSTIFLFAQIRNLLIHKNGIVDPKIKKILGKKVPPVGKRINLDAEIINEIISAVVDYCGDLVDRIGNIRPTMIST